jgi:hypothetical protein
MNEEMVESDKNEFVEKFKKRTKAFSLKAILIFCPRKTQKS